MTKLKSVSTEIVCTPAQAVTTQVQPKAITLIGNSMATMQQVAVLCRAGYYPQPDTVVEFFGHSGTMQIVLVPGTPDAHYTNAAAIALTEAAQREQGVFERAVVAEATRQIEAKARAEADAKRAAMIAAQKAQLVALEKQLAQEAVAEVSAAQ